MHPLSRVRSRPAPWSSECSLGLLRVNTRISLNAATGFPPPAPPHPPSGRVTQPRSHSGEQHGGFVPGPSLAVFPARASKASLALLPDPRDLQSSCVPRGAGGPGPPWKYLPVRGAAVLVTDTDKQVPARTSGAPLLPPALGFREEQTGWNLRGQPRTAPLLPPSPNPGGALMDEAARPGVHMGGLFELQG